MTNHYHVWSYQAVPDHDDDCDCRLCVNCRELCEDDELEELRESGAKVLLVVNEEKAFKHRSSAQRAKGGTGPMSGHVFRCNIPDCSPECAVRERKEREEREAAMEEAEIQRLLDLGADLEVARRLALSTDSNG